MKIGLVRHFKVKRGYPDRFVTSDELLKWVLEYDASDVEENEVNLCGVDWKKCYSSDLSRAKVTAQKAFKGPLVYLNELREIKLSPLFPSAIRLPLFFHLLFIRLAWWMNHKSQPESKQEIKARIRIFVERMITEEEDVLVVGHGGIMIYMRKELIRRGFKGPKFRRPLNGKTYIYEKLHL